MFIKLGSIIKPRIPEPTDLTQFSRDFEGFLGWRKKESNRYEVVKLLAPKGIKKELISWVAALLKMVRLLKPEKALEIQVPESRFCDCITSYLSPSWASKVHNIQFHVCKEHANHFQIIYGPYWPKNINFPYPLDSSLATTGN